MSVHAAKTLLTAEGPSVGRVQGADGRDYAVVDDPATGTLRLDPVPTPEDIGNFYDRHYYRLIQEGKRAADIARSLGGGAPAARQADWLRRTLHADIAWLIRSHVAAEAPRVLEFGCGLGNLLQDLAAAGCTVTGIDPAPMAVEAVREKGLEALQGRLEDLLAGAMQGRQFDAIIGVQVLNQLSDAASALAAAAQLLAPGGVLILQDGNDFNDLQIAACAARGLPPWWLSAPDHIHYLSFDRVERLMQAAGLEPVYRQGDFPMELFLLMGDDYIADPSLGAACHERRVTAELAMPAEVRRRMGQGLAAAGLGRCMLVAARKPL